MKEREAGGWGRERGREGMRGHASELSGVFSSGTNPIHRALFV